MDWPHDPDGEAGSEGRRKYGHAVIAKKVDEDADFPLHAGEFVEEYGEDPVRIDYETVISVADAFNPIDEDTEFADFPEFHEALGEAMRDQEYWPYHLQHA